MRWFQLLFVFLSLGAAEAATVRAVWIDSDPAIGAPWREVDDAFALVLAFHSPELRIAGVSTTYGNAGLRRTTSVARELVRRFGSPAGLTTDQVFPGAASPGEIEQPSAANEALVKALRRERLTYVALGPLTNLASFLRAHPDQANRIERVIFVGGRSPGYDLVFGPKGGLRIHDANAFKDPEAVRSVLRSSVPIFLAPIETSSRLTLDQRKLRELGRGGPAGQFLQRKSGFWMWFWTMVVREKGGPLFDVLAVLTAAQPELLQSEKRYASIDPAGNLIAARQSAADDRRILFCTGFAPRTEELIVRRLGGEKSFRP